MKKISIIILLCSLLSSCANPVIIPVREETDPYLNCTQIFDAIQSAERAKIAAHKEDRFRLRYIFIPIGVYSATQIMRADYAASDRIKYLEELSNKRQCGRQTQNTAPKKVNPQMPNYQQRNNYYQNPQYAPPKYDQQYINR